MNDAGIEAKRVGDKENRRSINGSNDGLVLAASLGAYDAPVKATLERAVRGIWKFETVAEVDGAVATSATMMVAPEVKA